MIARSPTERMHSSKPRSVPIRGAMLQRKCACGGAAGLTDECSDCQSKRLVGKPLQTKLRINKPGDEYEQEADRVADQVMGRPDATVNSETSLSRETPLVQRRVSGNGAARVGTPPSIVQDALSSPGQPLDAASRAFFEPRFGHDFGQVRVHADTKAADSARSVNALAYTAGQDVVFGSGVYTPGSKAGQLLLAHELAHVVQQGEMSPAMTGVAGDNRNSAAATPAASVGKPATVHPASGGFIQRQSKTETPTFPDFPGLLVALEDDVGKNLLDYGHHLYQASLLHPDEPQYLENALARYALGLNVLKTSYLFAGLDQSAADKLALGTGILFKGLSFVREGEFVLDYQIDIGKGLKLETNIDLNVNPDDYTDVQKAGVNIGVVGHF